MRKTLRVMLVFAMCVSLAGAGLAGSAAAVPWGSDDDCNDSFSFWQDDNNADCDQVDQDNTNNIQVNDRTYQNNDADEGEEKKSEPKWGDNDDATSEQTNEDNDKYNFNINNNNQNGQFNVNKNEQQSDDNECEKYWGTCDD